MSQSIAAVNDIPYTFASPPPFIIDPRGIAKAYLLRRQSYSLHTGIKASQVLTRTTNQHPRPFKKITLKDKSQKQEFHSKTIHLFTSCLAEEQEANVEDLLFIAAVDWDVPMAFSTFHLVRYAQD